MNYRQLGKTDLHVSEISLGAKWLERRSRAEVIAVVRAREEQGINIFDCWMSEPERCAPTLAMPSSDIGRSG